MLLPTPRDKMLDRQGRPYFLWDVDMTLEAFEAALRTASDVQRVYLVAKLMRQARPDDVFEFVSLDEIGRLWPQIEPQLGDKRAFWQWLLETWERRGHVDLAR